MGVTFMETNKMLITNNSIEFLNFELLKGDITISILHSGIVLYPGHKSIERPYYYKVTLDASNSLNDVILLKIFKDRGFAGETSCIRIKDHYLAVK